MSAAKFISSHFLAWPITFPGGPISSGFSIFLPSDWFAQTLHSRPWLKGLVGGLNLLTCECACSVWVEVAGFYHQLTLLSIDLHLIIISPLFNVVHVVLRVNIDKGR